MRVPRSTLVLLVVAVPAAGCTGGDDGATTAPASATGVATSSRPLGPTGSTEPGFSIPPPPTAAPPWTVDTTTCIDAAAAAAPIVGTLTIGTVAPQDSGLVSVLYAPVLAGFQAYVAQANARRVLGDVQIAVVVADDRGEPELTPAAVGGLLASEVDVVSAIPGSANNLAVRTLLNENCVPQVMSLASTPRLGEVAAYPWTMGGVVTDTVESTVYVDAIARAGGTPATIALLVSDDDSGMSFASALIAAASDAGLTVVGRQLVEPVVLDAPLAQVQAIATLRPTAVVASLSGPACATFLTELARVRTEIPDWQPLVYVSSGCADPALLRLAGTAADGVMSSVYLRADDPAFVVTMQQAGITSGFERAAEGWTAAEVTVGIAAEAARSAAGLTRASIMDAARHLATVPSLAEPGVEYSTDGTADPFPVESLQIVRYDAAAGAFARVGELVEQFES